MINSTTSWHELQHVVVILWLLDLQLAVQSVHITTKGAVQIPLMAMCVVQSVHITTKGAR
jgi:hypothetical protein